MLSQTQKNLKITRPKTASHTHILYRPKSGVIQTKSIDNMKATGLKFYLQPRTNQKNQANIKKYLNSNTIIQDITQKNCNISQSSEFGNISKPMQNAKNLNLEPKIKIVPKSILFPALENAFSNKTIALGTLQTSRESLVDEVTLKKMEEIYNFRSQDLRDAKNEQKLDEQKWKKEQEAFMLSKLVSSIKDHEKQGSISSNLNIEQAKIASLSNTIISNEKPKIPGVSYEPEKTADKNICANPLLNTNEYKKRIKKREELIECLKNEMNNFDLDLFNLIEEIRNEIIKNSNWFNGLKYQTNVYNMIGLIEQKLVSKWTKSLKMNLAEEYNKVDEKIKEFKDKIYNMYFFG